MAWGEPGEAADSAERRNGNGRRLRSELDAHDNDPYAHGQLVDRLTPEAARVRAGVEARVSRLERLAAQAVLLGVLGGIILGAAVGVLLARLLR